jgi:hypothetical protein
MSKPTLGGALFALPPTSDAPVVEEPEQQEMEGIELLDPLTSARRYWRDPLTGTQREIWRPGRLSASNHVQCTKADTHTGDGDGDVEHDHFERRGPLAPLDKRWRLYQVSHLPHSTANCRQVATETQSRRKYIRDTSLTLNAAPWTFQVPHPRASQQRHPGRPRCPRNPPVQHSTCAATKAVVPRFQRPVSCPPPSHSPWPPVLQEHQCQHRGRQIPLFQAQRKNSTTVPVLRRKRLHPRVLQRASRGRGDSPTA